jgi:hypothetical protein
MACMTIAREIPKTFFSAALPGGEDIQRILRKQYNKLLCEHLRIEDRAPIAQN